VNFRLTDRQGQGKMEAMLNTPLSCQSNLPGLRRSNRDRFGGVVGHSASLGPGLRFVNA